MSYQAPKTNWATTDGVTNTDLNRIEENIRVLESVSSSMPTTTGTAPAYTVTVPDLIDLTAGRKITIKFHAASSGVAATLNVNSLGVKSIIKTGGGNPNIKAGIYTLVYDGTSFQLLGEGGEYGTATSTEVLTGYTLGTDTGVVNGALSLTGSALAADVLSGETFYNTDAKTKVTGAMIDKRGLEVTARATSIVGTTLKFTLPYNVTAYDGNSIVSATDADFTGPNILAGKNVFGLAGTAQEKMDVAGNWSAWDNATYQNYEISYVPGQGMWCYSATNRADLVDVNYNLIRSVTYSADPNARLLGATKDRLIWKDASQNMLLTDQNGTLLKSIATGQTLVTSVSICNTATDRWWFAPSQSGYRPKCYNLSGTLIGTYGTWYNGAALNFLVPTTDGCICESNSIWIKFMNDGVNLIVGSPIKALLACAFKQ